VQYIIDGKQSMTVLKDVRTLVSDAIAAAIAYLTGGTPEQPATYNNGKIDVPASRRLVVTVDKANVKAALIDSGYYDAKEFTGLEEPFPRASCRLVWFFRRRTSRGGSRTRPASTTRSRPPVRCPDPVSDGDSAKEKANVESLIAQGVKVIVICPHDATAAAAAAAEAGLRHQGDLVRPLIARRMPSTTM